MKSKIQLITTTSSIDGWTIENYLGIVSYHLIAGTNLFKDMFAGLRDFFGGYSASYQKELDKLEDLGLKELKTKAEKLGANVIIGTRIDFDEISGGGKSMLMITISGTAAKATPKNSDKINSITPDQIGISKEEIRYLLYQEELKQEVLDNEFKIENIDDIKLLTKYQIFEAIKLVTSTISLPLMEFEQNKEIFVEYFQNIPENELNSFLREIIIHLGEENYSKLLIILKEIDWFDYETIYFFIDSPDWKMRNKGLYLLKNEPAVYSVSDISKLQIIADKIDNAYLTFPKYETGKGMFGKEKEVWICPQCQSKINMSDKWCTCGSDQFGFRDNKIDPFKLKDGVLKRIELLKTMSEQNES